ncbi:hypothetical protein BT69DRAFT_1306215 [Atractiella rhizophila]|nr:hypothetical protein BT69DRAFT_1306215 [Atractiella rhizophila]
MVSISLLGPNWAKEDQGLKKAVVPSLRQTIDELKGMVADNNCLINLKALAALIEDGVLPLCHAHSCTIDSETLAQSATKRLLITITSAEWDMLGHNSLGEETLFCLRKWKNVGSWKAISELLQAIVKNAKVAQPLCKRWKEAYPDSTDVTPLLLNFSCVGRLAESLRLSWRAVVATPFLVMMFLFLLLPTIIFLLQRRKNARRSPPGHIAPPSDIRPLLLTLGQVGQANGIGANKKRRGKSQKKEENSDALLPEEVASLREDVEKLRPLLDKQDMMAQLVEAKKKSKREPLECGALEENVTKPRYWSFFDYSKAARTIRNVLLVLVEVAEGVEVTVQEHERGFGC